MTRRDVSHIGRYEIQRRLGTGGMGTLHLARDPSLDRLVAIKLLKEDFQDDPELRERFIREARSVARLRHPNIVVVHDVGEDDGRPFMAMEYIAGETLTHVLRRTPSVPIVKRLAMIEDLCAGLAHAHAAGIIHRDIKPANVMLDGEGVIKILDFGIARIGNSGMTQEGMMMGTLNYMSPEQVAGRGVDYHTDIFATGAVLYEAIALEQAFPGRIDTGILQRILSEGPVPLEQRVPGVDQELAAIVRKALDSEPARRYQDINVMRQDLARVRRRLVEIDESGAAGAERDTTYVDRVKSSPPGTKPKVESDRPRRLSPERFAELRRQQVEEHLRFGEDAFARGDHDAALQYAERAATVDPDSRAAIDLIDKARLAIEGKAIRQLLTEAQRLLADGHVEDAAALAEEASATLPDIHGAADLRREVRQTVEKIAAARERERRIAASLDRAQSSLDQGAYETALRAVYEVLALDPDSAQARALEQRAKALLQTQREHERARRSAYDTLARAASLANDGKYEAAIEEISGVAAPSETVRVAAAAALASVRNSQRLAAQAGVVAAAQASFERGQLEEAQAAINSIPAEERTASARALQADVEKAIQAQQQLKKKQQALEAAIGTVLKLVDQNSLDRALEHLEEAAAIGLDDERIASLRQRIADITAAAEHKRRQEARDRVAAKRVEAAQRLLANGDGYAAIALLERDGSSHPLVDQALRDIRVAVSEHEERVRKEAERRRQEEEVRRRAELEAARKLEEQHRAEEQRKAEEQRRQLEEDRRRREAQREQQREEVATLVVNAERALAGERLDEATVLLKRAADGVASAEDTDLQRRVAVAKAEADRQIRRQQEEIRRREEEARQREEERRRQEARRQEEGRRAQEEKARQQAEAEAQRLREEQRRAAEKQRHEDEERRRRQEAINLLTSAEQTLISERPDEAAGLLTQAETIWVVRDDTELARRLHAARIEVLRQREQLVIREQERSAQKARDAQASEIAERARQLSASGQHDDALALLRRSPAHTTTQLVIDELESRRAQIERQREREARRLQRQQQRTAAVVALQKGLTDRRTHLLGAAVLSVAVVWAGWQYWPVPTPVAVVTPPPSAPPPTEPPPNTGGQPDPPPPNPIESPPPPGSRLGGPSKPADPRTGDGGPVTRPGPTPGPLAPPTNPPPPVQETELKPVSPPVNQGATNVGDNQQVNQRPPVTGPVASVDPGSKPPAPVAPVQPTQTTEAQDRGSIQQLLDQYVAAYVAMDERRIREIDPGFTGVANRVLLKSLELRMSNVSIEIAPDGQTAVLRATQNFRYEWNRQYPPTSSGSLRWNLRKIGGTWAVVR